MINAILNFSIRQRALVCAVWLAVFGFGLYCLQQLPIDAVPDITNKQVQINVVAPASGPEEVERRITFPLEVALAGLPKATQIRSISQFGLGQITVIFDDSVNLYFARQQVAERLQGVQDQLPGGVKTEMAPVSTGLGEIYYIRFNNPKLSLMERRGLMDWVIRPQLRTVQGLADVNTWGGEVKQVQVRIDPRRLREYSLDLHALALSLQANNANGGGSFMRNGPEQRIVRSVGMFESLEDVASVGVGHHDNVPVTLGQVAEVVEGPMLRQGAITQDGKGEEVYGIALLLVGENGRTVVERVKEKVRQLESTLPPGSKLEGFLDRSRLIYATLATASRNLAEGGLLVIGLLFLFLLQARAGLIVSCAIPCAMLVAVIGMYYFDISANLMSLGAIDFGLIVDGSVIIVENCVRCLAEERHRLKRPLSEIERRQLIGRAAAEVRAATQFGEILIISTYLPILSLEGVEGKMFRPMGWTVILALSGAMVLSFTLIPALCALFLRSTEESPHPVLEPVGRWYRRFLKRSLRYGWTPIVACGVIVLLSFSLLAGLGTEFIPELAEGSIAMQVNYPTSISLEETIRQATRIEKLIHQSCPESVERVVTRIGRPEIATDPMLTCQTDVLIDLKPGADQGAVVRVLDEKMKSLPGLEVSFTQPIKMRMMELIEGVGVKADLGIKLYGSDHQVLHKEAEKIAALVRQVNGSADVLVETTEGLPQLQINIRRDRIARLGIKVSDVNDVVEAALGGKSVTTINDGNRRFDVALRLPDSVRNDPQAIARLQVPTPDGNLVPLSELADLHNLEGPAQISRENGKRRIVVQSNVRGRDLGGFVEEVQRRIKAELHFPTGYYLEYGGTYEKLQSGKARLNLVVPITFILVFVLLYWTFGRLSLAFLVFTGIPFAISGGILALWLRGLPLSISAAIGFVALTGVSVLNGVVMVTFIEQLRNLKPMAAPHLAVLQGAVLRLRPVLMTAAVASIGFVPMAISHGSGAEVQRPLATVVIGGLCTSTLLTLWILPCLYLKLLPGSKPLPAKSGTRSL